MHHFPNLEALASEMNSANYTAPTLNLALHVTNVKKNLLFTFNSWSFSFISFSKQNYSTGKHRIVIYNREQYIVAFLILIRHDSFPDQTTSNNLIKDHFNLIHMVNVCRLYLSLSEHPCQSLNSSLRGWVGDHSLQGGIRYSRVCETWGTGT